MTPTVLIPTHPADTHAVAVALGLEKKGGRPILWLTPDFPMRAEETLRFGASGTSVEVRGPDLEFDPAEITTVWHRRPSHVLNTRVLDPADVDFAERSLGILRRSVLRLLRPDAFWVNPPGAVEAGTKPVQLARAQEAGFRIPETLITNDPEAIRRFLSEQGGRMIFKPLTASFWRGEDEVWAPYTQVVTEQDLVDDDLLRAAPGIYQEPIPKAYEVRLTLMGHRPLAVRLLSQSTDTGRTDWRRSYGELVMEPMEIPSPVVDRAISFLESMGLVFGCLDLIVTPGSEWVFVENNQAGQFLFVEQEAGVPMLDAFCELLLQGRPDFEWNPDKARLSLADFEKPALEQIRELADRHTRRADPSWQETTEPPSEGAS